MIFKDFWLRNRIHIWIMIVVIGFFNNFCLRDPELCLSLFSNCGNPESGLMGVLSGKL